MSQRSIVQKLLIKNNQVVMIVNEPSGYKSLMGELPSNVTVVSDVKKAADLIQVFVTSRKELEDQLKRIRAIVNPKTLLWVTYPKGTSKIKTDINRDVIANYARSIGLRPVALVSVNDIWSALRLRLV